MSMRAGFACRQILIRDCFNMAMLLLLASTAGRAQASIHGTRASADSAAIVALEQDIENGITQRNTRFLDSTFAPTFQWTHFGSADRRETRPQFLAALERAPSAAVGRTVARTADSIVVEVHGDIALTTGRTHVVRTGGTDFRFQDFTVRYVRLYRRNETHTRWQLVTHRATALTQGPPGQ